MNKGDTYRTDGLRMHGHKPGPGLPEGGREAEHHHCQSMSLSLLVAKSVGGGLRRASLVVSQLPVHPGGKKMTLGKTNGHRVPSQLYL